MKLKPFTAATEDEAMMQIRQELGEDAIIVSTHRSTRGRGVQILAALEEPAEDESHNLQAIDEGDLLYERLTFHGLSERNIYRLVREAVRSGLDDPVRKLGMALTEYIDFAPLPSPPSGLKLFFGPPGSGKTSVVAKLAARAAMAGDNILVATTDTIRPGAFTQLQNLTSAMSLDLVAVSTAEKLRTIAATAGPNTAIYLDAPGVNPFNPAEIKDLRSFILPGRVEPILVLPAGLDYQEMNEVYEAFASLNAKRMIVTRLDCARRLGAAVEMTMNQKLALAEVSLSASIVEGLLPLNEIRLARLLMHDPVDQHDRTIAGQEDDVGNSS